MSYIVAIFLILNSIVTVTKEIASTMLIATNNIKYDALSTIISAVISIILSLLFVKNAEAIGVSIAIFIGNFIGKVIIKNIVYKKILWLDINRFFRECYLKMMVPLITTLLVGHFTLYININNLVIEFLFKLFILINTYVFEIWKFSLNEYEKSIILKPINIIIYKFKCKGDRLDV